MTEKFYVPKWIYGMDPQPQNKEFAVVDKFVASGELDSYFNHRRFLLDANRLLQKANAFWFTPVKDFGTGDGEVPSLTSEYSLAGLSDSLSGHSLLYVCVNSDGVFTVYKCCRFGSLVDGMWQLPDIDDPALKDEGENFVHTGYRQCDNMSVYRACGTVKQVNSFWQSNVPGHRVMPLLLGKALCHYDDKHSKWSSSAIWTEDDVDVYVNMYKLCVKGGREAIPWDALGQRYDADQTHDNLMVRFKNTPYIEFREVEEVKLSEMT